MRIPILLSAALVAAGAALSAAPAAKAANPGAALVPAINSAPTAATPLAETVRYKRHRRDYKRHRGYKRHYSHRRYRGHRRHHARPFFLMKKLLHQRSHWRHHRYNHRW